MTEQTNPATTIPKDLQDSYNAAKSLALTHDLLIFGNYKYEDMARLTIAVAFIKSLHAQTMEALIGHPQSDLIEEIKTYKESIYGSKETSGQQDGSQPDSEASTSL